MQNELTKVEVKELQRELSSQIDEIIRAVKDGEVNAIEVKAKSNIIKKELERIDNAIEEEVNSEIDKYGDKFEFKGLEISRTYAKTYDYNSIPEIANLSLKIADLKKEQDELKKKYKGTTYKTTIVDQETGEVIKEEERTLPYTTTTRITIKVK